MTASPLLKPTMQFISHGFGFEPKVHKKSGGKGAVYEGIPVFRSGSFADSRGIRNNWEDLHVRQMVDNLAHLSKKNIIQSVPARDGHPEFLVSGIRGKGEVVGWHNKVDHKVMKSPVDGLEYTYLVVDYEITSPYALERIESGTWRNRSSEIGGYVTNDEAEFWPVYLGFAFVDFGAVEGLNFSMSQGNQSYVIFGENPLREKNVSGDNAPQQLLFGISNTQPQQPAAPAGQPFVFSVNGQNVTDAVAVQTYIGQIEAKNRQLAAHAAEVANAARKSYVASLVADKKMLASQQVQQELFALSLSDDQFTNWKSGWDAQVPTSVLGNHFSGSVNPDNRAEQTAEATMISDAKEIVAMHRSNGMKPEQLRETKSYGVLVAAGIEK